jgi:uncharacterized protein (DUF2236 family)
MLQVAHPTIAAGVSEHSDFQRDPLSRFLRSYSLVLQTIYNADGADVGAQVHAAHDSIAGTTANGRGYSAHEPEAYFWVLATGADTVREFNRRMGHDLTEAQRDRAYQETLEIGRRFGLQDHEMPSDRASFEAWYDTIVAERLESSDATERLVEVLSRPAAPRGLPRSVWFPFGWAGGHLASLITVGTLPESVRERLGLSFSPAQGRQLDAVCAALRAAGSAPLQLRQLPIARRAYARPVAAAAVSTPG